MKRFSRINELSIIFILILTLFGCEKQDSFFDEIVMDQQLKSSVFVLDQTTIDQINYLITLKEEIEALFEDGQLIKGNANSLIAKIENSIKSLEKGNENAAQNQLSAFMNEAEAYVESGILSEEQGESIINGAEQIIFMISGDIISLNNTTWDFTINYSETISWHADVTFYDDGTTMYDEPDYPGIYVFYGTWSMIENEIEYILDSSGSLGDNYRFSGTLVGTAMSGTFTIRDGLGTWSAVLK